MAEWKKLIVSGGVAELAGITSSILTDNNILVAGPGGGIESSGLTYDGTTLALGNAAITNNGTNNVSLSGSFSGSFTGDGSALTGVTADFPTTAQLTIVDTDKIYINDGTNKFVSASQTRDYVYGDVSGDITIADGGAASIATSLGTLGTNEFTGSFTGSFTGDGAGLTGIATTLTVGDESSTEDVALTTDTLKFVDDENTITTTVNKIGTVVEITASLASTIPGNRTFSGDTITIEKDLIVQGTASFQETENLRIADRFILLASGSTTAGDGGLVVQQNATDTGELFGFDSATSRWAITSSFHASQSAFTPLAYMPLVINNDDNDIAAYQKDGNIKISNAGDIYIYVE